MNPNVQELGFDIDAYKRLTFRLAYIAKSLQDHQTVLRNGNLASWEPELSKLGNNFEDLTDVLGELVTLLNVTINQKEQGLISPPNGSANPSDTPTG